MPNANWANPTTGSLVANFVTEVKNRDEDLALQFDGTSTSYTNIPTGTIRWNSSINRWQKWSGTAWGELTATYALTALSTTGNITVATASQPQLILNSTAAGSWKSFIRFQNSGTTKFEIGVDAAAAGNNNIYFYDSVAAANRAGIDSSGNFQFNSGYGSVATAYGCRAFANFNGTTATPSTIRASGNVSSITKNATADYTVNFTTALVDANYTAVFGSNKGTNAQGGFGSIEDTSGTTPPTTSALRVRSVGGNNGALTTTDKEYFCVAVFR